MSQPDPEEILAAVEERWWAGDSLRETKTWIKKRYGVELTSEQVRRTFVRLANGSEE